MRHLLEEVTMEHLEDRLMNFSRLILIQILGAQLLHFHIPHIIKEEQDHQQIQFFGVVTILEEAQIQL